MESINTLAQKWLYKLKNKICLIKVFWIIGWRSIAISLKRKPGLAQREFVNRLTRMGAVKILKTLKADFSIHYLSPFQMEKNTPYIFMSNHQSLLDLPLIFATVLGNIRVIAKKELFSIPLFGRALTVGECIPLDRENPLNCTDFFKCAKERLNDGLALWIFPEGTRSKDGNLQPFKIGGFRLAKEMAAKIVPVGIINTRNVLPPGKFTATFNQAVQIRVGQPIDTREYSTIAEQKKTH